MNFVSFTHNKCQSEDHIPCAHVDTCPLFAARLDGTGERGRERLARHHTIEDWLELETGTSNQIPGKKRVGILHADRLLYCFLALYLLFTIIL